jgi:hypothetical protein
MVWTARIESAAAVGILHSLCVFESSLLHKIHVFEPRRVKEEKPICNGNIIGIRNYKPRRSFHTILHSS